MKRWKIIFLCAVTAAILVMAGCGTASKAQSNGTDPGGKVASRADGGTLGIITEISDSSIIVAQMPAGSMPQGDGGNDRQPPSGTRDGNDESPPPAPTGDEPQGSAPAASGTLPQATADTSDWEKTTWTIDKDTRIVSGSGSSGSDALTLSDLKVGDNVNIVAKTGQTTVAGQITVMQGGMGGFPGGDAPAASTAKD